MTTIGVYDSGVGGLTTLKLLQREFPFADFYYLADNKNMPFGTKDEHTLCEIFECALAKLKAHSEIQVFACNTASTLTADNSVIKLLPPAVEGDTLVLATPQTVKHLKAMAESKNSRCKFADTPELASLVETYVTVSARKNCLNMRELLPYVASKLFEFKGVKNVVLGCSHYLYLKNEISSVLGTVNFVDGNSRIVETLKKQIEPCHHQGKIAFDFTADDESTKYEKIYSLVLRDLV